MAVVGWRPSATSTFGRTQREVRARAARHHVLRGELADARDHGDRLGAEPQGDPRALRHLPSVAEEPEPGDVGERVHRAARGEDLPRRPVERAHHLDGAIDERRVGLLRLDRGGRDPAAERLREEEHVARARAHVPEDAIGVDDAGDRHPVLGLGVVDRVAAEDGRAGEPRRLRAAAQDLSEQLHRELRDRPADEVQREERPRAHRPHVGERVRRGDAAEPVRVVHDGREEVDRLDDRLGVREPVHGGVVARLGPDERARVIDPGHVAQHLRQIRRADLAGSTRAVAEAREADLLLGLHGASPYPRAHPRATRRTMGRRASSLLARAAYEAVRLVPRLRSRCARPTLGMGGTSEGARLGSGLVRLAE